MTDSDKPFTLYRLGPGSFRIVPRNLSGWWYTLGWSALWLVVFGLYVGFARSGPDEAQFVLASIGFAVVTLAWAFGSMFWMSARSKVVDLTDAGGRQNS